MSPREATKIERNKEVANLYLSTDLSMQEISEQYGVSRERIRQIVEALHPDYHRPPKYHPTKEEKREIRIQRRIRVFWSRTYKDNKTGCLEWTGTIHPVSGYGLCNLREASNSHTRYVHRLSWILTYGPIPEGLNVLHKCDNTKCVNPSHLYLGTQTDNIRDREERFGNAPWKDRDKTKTPRRSVSNETLI